MSAPLDLFHLIADKDSAEVRRFITTNALKDQISFRNVAYESHAAALKSTSGATNVPCLVGPNGVVIRGKEAILAYLETIKR